MRLFFLLILSMLFSSFALMAQEDAYYLKSDFEIRDFEPKLITSTKQKKQEKLDFGVNMGSSFSSFYGNSIFTNHLSPEVSYSFNPKFRLSTGTMFTYSMYDGFKAPEQISNNNFWQKQANFYLYAKGEYQVSNNLIIRAGGIAEVSNSDSNGFKSGNFGMSLKLGESTYFHADFNFSSGHPGADLYYSNGGIFNNPYRFGNEFGHGYGFGQGYGRLFW